MKIPKKLDDRMYKAYKSIWQNGIFRVKQFQNYCELVEDLNKQGYDIKEYRRLIEIKKSLIKGMLKKKEKNEPKYAEN